MRQPALQQFPKDSKVVYSNRPGNRFSAIVLTAHKDGTRTVRLQWYLDREGKESQGCYQGDKFRVPPHMLSVWQG